MTRAELAKGEQGAFPGFPYYATFLPRGLSKIVDCGGCGGCFCGKCSTHLTGLSNAQANLLAGLADWAVSSNEELWKSMFEE